MTKRILGQLGTLRSVQMRENLIHSLAAMLRAYRQTVSSITPMEIQPPDSMHFLPSQVLGLLKLPAFKLLGELKIDEKFASIMSLVQLPMPMFARVTNPRVY